jgi:hypothetical protein
MTQDTAVLSLIEDDRIASMGFYLDPGQARRDAGLD